MVPRFTRIPSFNNSPRIRFDPQRRFSTAICLISAMVSSDSRGLRACPFDFCRHKSLNPCRCHRSNVCGFTINKAFFQSRTRLANHTSSPRSPAVNCGRATCRFSTITCWRRNAFSATSSGLLFPKSAAAPPIRLHVAGFVHAFTRASSFLPIG